MIGDGDNHAQRVLEFIEAIRELDSYEDVAQRVLQEFSAFGLDFLTIGRIPNQHDNALDAVMLNNRADWYTEHYAQEERAFHDPVLTELRFTVEPYSWSEVRTRRDLTKTEKRIMGEATDFGAKEGLIVPIIAPPRSLSLVSACGHDPELTDRARSALEMISIYGNQALLRLSLNAERANPIRKPLTGRERDVLRWVAIGKNDDEISDILSISTSTVTKHVENAKAKLGAYKRTFAVVQAIRYGEIVI